MKFELKKVSNNKKNEFLLHIRNKFFPNKIGSKSKNANNKIK